MSNQSSGYRPPADVHRAGGGNIGGMFAAHARRRPDTIALQNRETSLTYRQLNARVNRLAHVFRAHGIGRGDRIGLLARNCFEFIEVELAAAKIGAIAASLNWRLSATELAHCIELTSPGLLLTQPGYVERLDAAGSETTERLVIGETYETCLAEASDDDPTIESGGEDGLVIIFTSGTTGLPKGALISHRAMIARTMIFGAELGAPVEDTFVAWTPLFHMGANDFSLGTLMRGGKVIVIDGYDADALIDAVQQETIHYLPLIPGMIAEFIEALRARRPSPKGIGFIGAMADLVPRAQLAEITKLLNAPYLNTFGSTETGTPPATGNTLPIGETPTSLSKWPNEFCEIRLVDADDNDVPDGAPGETRHPRTVIVFRLLAKPGGQCRELSGRLVSHGRCVPAQRRRQFGFRRSGQIHDQVRRRKHLPGRDRTAHPGAPGHRRRRRGPQTRCEMGRSPRRLCPLAATKRSPPRTYWQSARTTSPNTNCRRKSTSSISTRSRAAQRAKSSAMNWKRDSNRRLKAG